VLSVGIGFLDEPRLSDIVRGVNDEKTRYVPATFECMRDEVESRCPSITKESFDTTTKGMPSAQPVQQ
jgi:hypothetical protein